jgi:hypothetical protein
MGFGRFWRRATWDRVRLEEMESYVQIETDENLARGMQYNEARAAARRKFGNSTMIREEIYSMNTIAFSGYCRPRRSLRFAHAASQSHVHRGGLSDADDRYRRQHGGLQRLEQRAAETAPLSKGG